MTTGPLLIDGHGLTLRDVVDVALGGREVVLSEPAREEMSHSYAWVQQAC